MPLFNFKCLECGNIVEKFQRGKDTPEITCVECEHAEFEKILGACHSRKWLDARELYNEKIAPDARRITEGMDKKDKHFFDIYGEK